MTLTATITPATATGNVQFKDGANPLGPPVTVSNGAAEISIGDLASGYTIEAMTPEELGSHFEYLLFAV